MRLNMKNKKVLIVAAHPDDEILGCGATVARLIKEGWQAYSLILGEGVTARDETRKPALRKKDIDRLKACARQANKAIGVKEVFMYDFPDNRFDAVALLDIIKTVEKIKNRIKPFAVYTHHPCDLNIDHQVTYEAVLTACRPVKGETVKKIYSFEIPSSTEWNYPYGFSPNMFVDVAKTMERKIKALRCYKSEMRKAPHPRSLERIKTIGRRWVSVSGLDYAEAFELVRCVE